MSVAGSIIASIGVTALVFVILAVLAFVALRG